MHVGTDLLKQGRIREELSEEDVRVLTLYTPIRTLYTLDSIYAYAHTSYFIYAYTKYIVHAYACNKPTTDLPTLWVRMLTNLLK